MLSWPRPLRENPYQALLHEACEGAGAAVSDGAPNLWSLLRGPRGPKVLHVHWIWLKKGRLARLFRAVRAVTRLHVATARGWTIVWTAHNIEPHESGNLDRWVRQSLLDRAHGVIAHTRSSARQLREELGYEGPIAMLPHGRYPPPPGGLVEPARARSDLDLPRDSKVLLHLGQLRPYKGTLALVEAFRELPHPEARLLIAGHAPDAKHLQALESAAASDTRILLRPSSVPEGELATWFGAADWVALPFERITTSGSLVLALGFARGLIVPRQEELVEMAGEEAALWYDGSREGLREVLEQAVTGDASPCARAAAARAQALDWAPIGRLAVAFFEALSRARD